MKQYKYLALLRGINVGGNNLIKMTALKACFEALGFKHVTTFIQSGNVAFTSSEKDSERLCKKIEKALSAEFDYKACVVLVTGAHLKKVIEQAPKGFGKDNSAYRYDAIFFKEPLRAKQVIKTLPLKEGVDVAFAGSYALYFSRLTSKATQSRLSRIVLLPVYKRLTIRNWNTTTKLQALMENLGK